MLLLLFELMVVVDVMDVVMMVHRLVIEHHQVLQRNAGTGL
jgi:hypothetical protein